MSEFWLISVPGDKTNLAALDRMYTVTSKANLSENAKFIIPDLKVGTLDALIGLSDDLGKLDVFAESVIKKIVQYIGEVMNDSAEKAQENLLANGGSLKEDASALLQFYKEHHHWIEELSDESCYSISKSDGVDLVSYLARFEWDMAKYPVKQPLQNLTDSLSKQMSQIDADLKSRAHTYNNIKGNLQSLERKTVGSLLTRTLADIVNKEDFVLNSEYLITLLVVVPKTGYAAWQKTYESLSTMVVPRSTKLIAEDADGGLFTVTLFRKVIDEFKAKARENKFMVREFCFNEKELQTEKDEIMKLIADKKQQYLAANDRTKELNAENRPPAVLCIQLLEAYLHADIGDKLGPLLRWLKVNFSEAFIAWVHIKALRVFVESVLRYGLPVNFHAVILHPNKKSMKRLRDVLNALFRHLDEAAAANMKDVGMDIPGLQLNNQDYYPYVCFKIDLNNLDFEP